jgi:DNA-binding CsgD family transcriptional regulator
METHEISKKETEVIRLKSIGLQHKEIAERLGISLFTVQTHFQNIHRKLRVRDDSELIIWFYRTQNQTV